MLALLSVLISISHIEAQNSDPPLPSQLSHSAPSSPSQTSPMKARSSPLPSPEDLAEGILEGEDWEEEDLRPPANHYFDIEDFDFGTLEDCDSPEAVCFIDSLPPPPVFRLPPPPLPPYLPSLPQNEIDPPSTKQNESDGSSDNQCFFCRWSVEGNSTLPQSEELPGELCVYYFF